MQATQPAIEATEQAHDKVQEEEVLEEEQEQEHEEEEEQVCVP